MTLVIVVKSRALLQRTHAELLVTAALIQLTTPPDIQPHSQRSQVSHLPSTRPIFPRHRQTILRRCRLGSRRLILSHNVQWGAEPLTFTCVETDAAKTRQTRVNAIMTAETAVRRHAIHRHGRVDTKRHSSAALRRIAGPPAAASRQQWAQQSEEGWLRGS